MNGFRLLVVIPSLYNPANYGRYSVCFLSPGVSYPPVITVYQNSSPRQILLPHIFPHMVTPTMFPVDKKASSTKKKSLTKKSLSQKCIIIIREVCSNTCDFRKSYSTARREKRYIHRHTHFWWLKLVFTWHTKCTLLSPYFDWKVCSLVFSPAALYGISDSKSLGKKQCQKFNSTAAQLEP